MAWNEPGNQGGNPWGSPPPHGTNPLQALLQKLATLFGAPPDQEFSGSLIAIVLAALTAVWAILGFYQLDEQQRAVVLRFGAFHEEVTSGIHWNPPIIDTVLRENVTQQRAYTAQGAMLTEDENIVEVQLSVQYNINDLKKYVLGIRQPEHALFEATDSALRHAVGSSKMDDVLTTGRAKIEIDVQTRLQRYLDKYQTGIQITKINVEKTQAPSAVQSAFDDVIKAREDEQRVQNEAQAYANSVIPEARGQATRLHEEAIAYRDRIIARADGEANRFEALLTEYRKAPAVTRERLYLEAMQDIYASNPKVLLDLHNNSNIIYLPSPSQRDKNPAAATALGNTGDNKDTAIMLNQATLDALADRLKTSEQSPRDRLSSGREGRP